MTPLTGKQKRYLRGLAHSLKPVAQIGKSGISETFTEQVEQHLFEHELIKVKVLENAAEDKKFYAQELSQKTSSHVAQIIGKTIVLYKERADEPNIQLPKSTDE